MSLGARDTLGFEPQLRLPGAAVLMRYAKPADIMEGAAAVLSLQTLRIRLDDRWPRRRESVWDTADQVLARHLRPGERYERIGECAFLVVVHRDNAAASVAVAGAAAKEMLSEILGVWRPQDLDVSRVVGVDGPDLVMERLSPSELEAAAAEWAKSEELSRRRGGAADRAEAVSFVSARGKRLELTMAQESVVHLKQGHSVGVRLSRSLIDTESGKHLSSLDRVHLDANDLAFIDGVVMRESLGLLRHASLAGPMIVPISFQTLARTGARTRLFGESGLVPGDMSNPWIAEIAELEPGTPSGRLAEVAALLRPYTQVVFAEPLAKRPVWRTLSDARIGGAALDLHDRKLADAEIAKLMLNFGDKAQGEMRTLLCYGLPSEAFFDIALVAGFSHASVRAEAEAQAAA